MVLNAAARPVVGTGKFSHVTPILRDVLHWLPVQHRISYKIAILARDCIHGIGPAYFGDVCAPVTAAPGRTNLRSATRGDLLIPRTQTEFPYIRTDGVELTPWFAQAFCYKPRTFSERTENIPTCLGKPTHQPLRTNKEWTYLLTYLLAGYTKILKRKRRRDFLRSWKCKQHHKYISTILTSTTVRTALTIIVHIPQHAYRIENGWTLRSAWSVLLVVFVL